MSVKLMSKAWEMDIPSGQKMVLLALCDHANDDGECYPSQKKLAKKCSMSSRAISNHIKWLHDCGILESERRQTTNVRKSNRYFISLENYQAANSAHANSAHANSAHANSAYPNMQNFPSEHANFAPSYIDEPSERTIRVEPSDICDDAFAPFAPPLELEPVADKPPMTAKPKKPTLAKQRKQDALQLLADHGVDGQLALDYLAVREDRKARTLTQTAIAGLEREAVRAGLTLAQAVTVCVERNWAGFNADWLHSSGQQGFRPQPARQSVKQIPQHTLGGAFLAKDIL